jgi:hypothetical protein
MKDKVFMPLQKSGTFGAKLISGIRGTKRLRKNGYTAGHSPEGK